MKSRILIATFPVLLSAALLGGCSGGGDAEAGSPTPYSIQPSSLTVTAPTGTTAGVCATGYVGDVFVFGGTAPYRLNNTAPDAVLLHRSATDFTPISEVSDRGGSFSVSFTNGICLSPATVIVMDKLDHQVILTLNNQPAG